ncbi:histidinol-phosphate transaminase [Enterococcus ureilyticus]|uniref:Histidinol-phosphate aminotransferase n=1 Tax=Enterococcus ureilyticus TaxID=1131292 RepID=A0A1E5H857_9ENTE|nr:histidinol-phosphate transaminase [Enterococcus ureilyticus]MBM7688724.1 histidinol-phosphate aminotransferase [Enterococcus ureilyticus]OEG21148.1 histidinol-phosphate transaminase [Enterococcus ureilyticus]
MKGIRKITPYVPGEQPNYSDMIKLNTNENPYPPSPKVKAALNNFDTEQLKRYSSINNPDVKAALATKHGLSPKHFIIGNGSDEVLAFCFLAFFNSSDPLLFPDITYGFYKVWADLFHIPYRELPLNEQFAIDLKDYTQTNGGIIIANPNAPTGLFKPIAEIKQLLEMNPDVIVIIDEAYIDFATESAVSLLDNYPNLVIVRTLSKSSSLAGLRVGYALGNPIYIQVVESIKSSFNPYSVDMLAECLAVAALEDDTYYTKITNKICETRNWFTTSISNLGFQALSSQTNFILLTHPDIVITELYHYLESQDVFVRYFSTIDRLKNYLRVSIGTQEEMEKVQQLLVNYLQNNDK